MTRPEHVVIVGGGITGLTAAYRFTQAGSAVTVIEPHKLGGKVQTSVFAGRPVDESADNFLLRVPHALALCRDLDLDGELVSPAARTAEVFLDGTNMGKVPLDIKQVKGGDHVLEVKAPGYQPHEERITINDGQSTVLKLDLNA